MNLIDLVRAALQEDMPEGDKTTDSLNCENVKGEAKLVAKQNIVLSGVEPFETVFKTVDASTEIRWYFSNGAVVSKGSEICHIKGKLPSLLKAERAALNFLGHLSGVATLTKQFVEKTNGTKCKIRDTRKTMPGMRDLEKQAVAHGGGSNHRHNLSDGILIKENHIRTAGSITEAVSKIKSRFPQMKIEVEVTSPEEIKEAMTCGVEELLLDNMTDQEIAQALDIIRSHCKTEASGNMTLERISRVAQLGVDYISVGLITHSAPAADVSLLFEQKH